MPRRLAPFVILTLLCLPAIQPYLGGAFPRTNDAATHLYRAFELDRLIRAGVFFPRWAPDFAHGYGYPTFNYFPYLSHYLIEAFHLIGLPMLSAMRAAFALAILVAGWTAFLLARDLFGDEVEPGIVAAAAYVYSPYLLYTFGVRGGLPEGLVLALSPLLLFAVRRLARGDWRFFPLVSLTLAAMTFAHLGGVVQVAPFVVLFGVISHWSSVVSRQSSVVGDQSSVISWQSSEPPGKLQGAGHASRFTLHASLLTLSLLLGLALPAFHWLPAQAELEYVQFAKGFSSAGIAYYLNFQHLGELFTLPRLPIDLDLLNPPVVRPLPLVACVLALITLFRWRSSSPETRRVILFFAFVLFASAFLTLDLSKFIWERLPLLQQTLWPWRYLAPASLAAAVLAGGVVSRHSLISTFIVSLSIATSLPWLYPPREPLPEAPTLADLARAEIPPALVGTTTTGEYTPEWVKEWPDTSATRAEQIAGREPERLDPASLPNGATFAVTVRNSQQVTYLLNLPSDTSIVYRTFFFPGWQVELDGNPLALRPTDPDGLISFDVPAGQHVVSLGFADTPARRAGRVISIVAIAGLVAVISYQLSVVSRQSSVVRGKTRSTKRRPRITYHREASLWDASRITLHREASLRDASHSTLHWSLFILSLFIIKFALLDTALLPIVRHGLRDGKFAGAQHGVNQDFGGELTLLGYDLSREAISANGATTLNLYWKAQHSLGVPYGLGVRLVDEHGLVWSRPDIERPRDLRFFPGTDNWPPDQYILDPYVIRPIAGAPPGQYDLEVVAYRQLDLQAIGSEEIGRLEIVAPHSGPVGDIRARTSFGEELTLLTHHFDRAAAAPGDPLLVTLTWQASRPLGGDLRARLDLVADGSNETAFSHEFPIVERYPTSRWKAQDVLTDQILLRLSAALSSDTYQWYLTVFDTAGRQIGARALLIPFLGDEPHPEGFTVTAPPRSFTLPVIAQPLNVELGDSIALRGFSLSVEAPRSDEPFTVSLVWQARAEMPVSYDAFLHLTDSQGNLVAQSDGAPANWTRPTTGWLTNEVVVDERTLTLPADAPPGDYALWAGMFDPVSGERLPVAGSVDNRVLLGNITIGP